MEYNLDLKKRMMITYDLRHGILKSTLVKKYDVSRGIIENAPNYFKSEYKNNSEIRNQIVLGSLIGDGTIQIKKGKYVYRECHSIKETEYLIWKYLMFDEWTNNCHICEKNRKYNNHSDANEFCTSRKYSEVFENYYNMSKIDVIRNMNIYGLIVFLLDDGWFSNHSSIGNLCISSGALTDEELNEIILKFKCYDIEVHKTGKRQDLNINSRFNYVILSYLIDMFPTLEIDVIDKKFGFMKKHLISTLSRG